MSLTRSRGVFGTGHWTAVSAAVVEYLDYLLGTYREMKEVEVPANAIRALKALLASALEATKNELMQNPQVSINDYLIVREVMRSGGAEHLEREDVGKMIEEYSSLLERLAEPHTMEDLSRELVVKTRIFFRNLQALGESDAYDRRMREAHPYNHYGDPVGGE